MTENFAEKVLELYLLGGEPNIIALVLGVEIGEVNLVLTNKEEEKREQVLENLRRYKRAVFEAKVLLGEFKGVDFRMLLKAETYPVKFLRRHASEEIPSDPVGYVQKKFGLTPEKAIMQMQ